MLNKRKREIRRWERQVQLSKIQLPVSVVQRHKTQIQIRRFEKDFLCLWVCVYVCLIAYRLNTANSLTEQLKPHTQAYTLGLKLMDVCHGEEVKLFLIVVFCFCQVCGWMNGAGLRIWRQRPRQLGRHQMYWAEKSWGTSLSGWLIFHKQSSFKLPLPLLITRSLILSPFLGPGWGPVWERSDNSPNWDLPPLRGATVFRVIASVP